jgi:hypothetical protein
MNDAESTARSERSSAVASGRLIELDPTERLLRDSVVGRRNEDGRSTHTPTQRVLLQGLLLQGPVGTGRSYAAGRVTGNVLAECVVEAEPFVAGASIVNRGVDDTSPLSPNGDHDT